MYCELCIQEAPSAFRVASHWALSACGHPWGLLFGNVDFAPLS
jgi:hypothetical protein